jgi:hypothetical protein
VGFGEQRRKLEFGIIQRRGGARFLSSNTFAGMDSDLDQITVKVWKSLCITAVSYLEGLQTDLCCFIFKGFCI